MVFMDEGVVGDASIALGGNALPCVLASQIPDAPPGRLPKCLERRVDRSLSDSGDDIEFAAMRVFDELPVEDAPSDDAGVPAGVFIVAVTSIILRNVLRLSRARAVNRRLVSIVMEDAVVSRDLDEEKIIFCEVANERCPKANHDLLLERLLAEERKVLAITSS